MGDRGQGHQLSYLVRHADSIRGHIRQGVETMASWKLTACRKTLDAFLPISFLFLRPSLMKPRLNLPPTYFVAKDDFELRLFPLLSSQGWDYRPELAHLV